MLVVFAAAIVGVLVEAFSPRSSRRTAHLILCLVSLVAAFILTILWVRTRELREKYAVVWIGVAFTLLVIGLFPSLVMMFADQVHLAYPSAVLYIALAAIYLFAFSTSVSISRQYRRTVRLMQELAIMEMKMRELQKDRV